MRTHIYIIEVKHPPEDWKPVTSFPGMKLLYSEYFEAKEAAEVMMNYDGTNKKAGLVIRQYRACRYEPAE